MDTYGLMLIRMQLGNHSTITEDVRIIDPTNTNLDEIENCR
jgi:hypothetical protein